MLSRSVFAEHALDDWMRDELVYDTPTDKRLE